MLYLLNTTVVPCGADGIWKTTTLQLESAKMNIRGTEWVSAVGHESTAAIMSELLGVEVPANRIQVSPEPGDKLLCFKLKNRAPEGAILNREQIQKIGYEWVRMDYHGTVGAAIDEEFKALNDYITAIRHFPGF
jgi:hypothetical protein